ncbi:MAG: peptidylprolyl isomerase [Oscillospiraceae bacterium]|nr:peptidylprolyl isomerase [Oscillospiraceae bacterium]
MGQKKKSFIFIAFMLIFSVSLIFMQSCGGSNESNAKIGSADNPDDPQVRVQMDNGGSFVIELYPEYAPNTVENFLKLVNDGFYDGLTFHRIVAGFMAQGGDPNGDGSGGSDQKITGEFSANGFTQNTLSHTKYVVSMARSDTSASGDPTVGYNSASSQFFIMFADDPADLDGLYAAFGKVIDGTDVIDNLAKVKVTANAYGEVSKPVNPVVIKKMIELK